MRVHDGKSAFKGRRSLSFSSTLDHIKSETDFNMNQVSHRTIHILASWCSLVSAQFHMYMTKKERKVVSSAFSAKTMLHHIVQSLLSLLQAIALKVLSIKCAKRSSGRLSLSPNPPHGVDMAATADEARV